MVNAADAPRAMSVIRLLYNAALVASRRWALFLLDFTFDESTRTGCSHAISQARNYSAVLIVPFGNNVVTEPFCTTTSVPVAISRVM
jgi:hypothetical protein